MKVKIIIDIEVDEEWNDTALSLYAEDAAGMLWADNHFKGTFIGSAERVEEDLNESYLCGHSIYL